MPNQPGFLNVSKSQEFQCQNCSLIFDSKKHLQNHQAKYCINSKYGNLQVLQRQFKQKSKGRDISLYGKQTLINIKQNKNLGEQLSKLNQNSQLLGIESVLKNNQSILLDKEYQSVIDQLLNKESLKKKLQRQKNQAYQQLQFLQKRQNDMLIDTKQQELHEILKRRQQLQQQQKTIQEQVRLYQKKKKQMEKQVQMIDKQDYIYKQARYAGKLAKQRQILEQKKKQMEHNLKQKRKQRNEIQHKLHQSKMSQKQVYIPPDFKKNKEKQPNINRKVMTASKLTVQTPEDSLDSLSFQNTNRSNDNRHRQNDNFNQYNSTIPNTYIPHQNVGIQHWSPENNKLPTEINNFHPSTSLKKSTTQLFNLPHQKYSNPLDKNIKTQQGDDMYPYFTPQPFSKNQKLLTDVLNRNGKSEQDRFIELLNAQQFDSLNLLSKIPKGSQLYELKLKQYQQLSKLRDDYKKQAHQKRIEKMKREFDYEKKIMQKQMQNALWVDENRKLMLAQQINIMKNQQEWSKEKQSMLQQNFQPQMGPSQTMGNQNHNFNNPYSLNNNNNIKNTVPSIQNLRSNNNISNNKNNFPSNTINNNSGMKPLSQQSNAHQRNQGGTFNGLSNGNISLQNKNNSSPQIDPSNYFWGYKIIIQNLKNYYRSKPVKIKVIVKQYDVTNSLQNYSNILQYEFSTSYHYQKIKPQEASFNPNINNKFDKNNTLILYKEEFFIPINLQQHYNKNQNQLYLFIFAQEKDQTKLSNEPTTYSWYNMKLTHFGQLKEGKFTVSLYSDPSSYPHPSDMNKKKNKLKQEITLQLNEVIVQKQQSPYQQNPSHKSAYQPPEVVQINSNKNKTSQNQQGVSQNTNSHFSNNSANQFNNKNKVNPQISQTSIGNQMGITNQSLKSSNQQFRNTKQSIAKNQLNFIPNDFETQFVKTSFKQQKNIDISISQVRTLPSYTGPIKLQLSFIDSQGTLVLPKQEILSQINSPDMYNPFVNYVRKIRKQRLMSPSTLVFIRILGINALDYQIYMLGFTIFYIFFDQNTEPCMNNDMKQYFISKGFFQLPIFWGSCQPHFARIQDIIQKYPLIPCSSLLLGCNINQSEKALPIPPYSEKVYNTLLFNVQENQLRLFEEQYKREKLDTNKILAGYLKFKGISSGYTFDQAKNYIFKVMSFTKDITSNTFPLQYMAEYNSFFGIYFSIDKIVIPKTQLNFYYFATICLSPPSKYYTSKKRDNADLIIMHSIQPETSKNFQLIFEGNQFAFQPKYNINASLIIQFKRIKIGKDNQITSDIQNYGYVIIPIFKEIQGVRCVNAMKDTVNTYLGEFKSQDIKQIQMNLPQYLDKLAESVKPSQIQLSFRLLNGYFTTQYQAQKLTSTNDRKSKYLRWYSRPIDFEDAKKKVRLIIQRKYGISL